jgi:hypothetical protein
MLRLAIASLAKHPPLIIYYTQKISDRELLYLRASKFSKQNATIFW